MATKVKKKSVPKKIKTKPPQDPHNLLRDLYARYDFGPTMNKTIAKTLGLERPLYDPLLHPPAFMIGQPVRHDMSDRVAIGLGHVDGYSVVVRYYKREKSVAFLWGCRKYYMQDEARAHWQRNVSRLTHRSRPHADELMNYVDQICRFNKWKW